MGMDKRWDIYFQQHNCPCFIADKDTTKILYCNNYFKKTFDIEDHIDIIGENFYDVIKSKHLTLEKEPPNWNEEIFFESNGCIKKSNTRFLFRATKMENDNAIFCELIPNNTKTNSNVKFEEAIMRCMEIYAQPYEMIIPSLMEVLCKFYECERAYVYRINFEKDTLDCIAQSTANPEHNVIEEISVKFDTNKLVNWLETESDCGLISASIYDENLDKQPVSAEILEMFNLQNITLNVVEDINYKIVGAVGLSNSKNCNKIFDPRLINTIARMVAQEASRGQLDANLLELYHKDSLTGLYNRVGFTKRLEQIMSENPQSMGVISVNINGLRYINERAGISKGDEHIKKCANLLTSHFDFEFFRMSGDEFLGIAPNVCEDDFEEQAMSLYSIMKKENNHDFSLGHTWGQGKINVAKLSQEADLLMYINKQQYYSSSKREFDSISDTTLSDLLSYLADDEFMVYLQPQVRLKDGSHYGAEALIRRFDKKAKKMVFPDQFIPLYEQKSVIRHVDMFVLETICKLQSKWVKSGVYIPISVNFSRVTLQEYGIVESITEICDKYDVPHNLVVIEVTERVGLIENNVASELITKFKGGGFNISLDDFGCAYSNIVTLAQIEVDEVKIDKSLVDFIMSNKKNHILVKNILSMCNELDGTSTLAEGIEDEEQGKILYELGCHLGQGYYYSRPIPVDEFVEKYISN